jgi:hypothetical protein
MKRRTLILLGLLFLSGCSGCTEDIKRHIAEQEKAEKAAMDKKRFTLLYKQDEGPWYNINIIQDQETGVKYIYVKGGGGCSITPLITTLKENNASESTTSNNWNTIQ